jgi:hypothetical protein
MKRTVLVLLVASVVAVAAAGWYIYRTLSAEPAARAANATQAAPATPAGSAAPAQRVQVVNGETVVVVGNAVQRAAHIEAAPVASTTVIPQAAAYGSVIDPQPLFDLRNRLATARADRDGARAQADASRAQYERTRALFEDNRNVSQKSLQDAGAAMVTDHGKLQAAQAAESALETMLRQQFGSTLARAASAPDSKLLQRLASGAAVLLRVTLPTGMPAHREISIDVPGEAPFPARKVSASPQADPAVQGSPYFYAAEHVLPAGTRVTARVPKTDSATAGLRVPESAIVWYGGARWVYVKTAPARFTRRYLPSPLTTDQGVVVTGGLQPGDKVVVEGAELLLSEELRPQGPGTQCKDPECD